ncbi:MAG: hypothetical protein AAF236_02470 [Verrucomicrobiota bacterium]
MDSCVKREWAAIWSVLILFIGAAAGQSEPEVGAPVPSLTLTTVDRFGDEVGEIPIQVLRKKEGRIRMMEIPTRFVAEAVSDSRGQVHFDRLRVGDRITGWAASGLYLGSVEVDGTTEQILRLNRHSGFAMSHTDHFSDGDQERTSEAAKVLTAILDHHVEIGAREFHSLDQYQNEGIIDEQQIEKILVFAAEKPPVLVYWSTWLLILNNRSEPIRWVEMDRKSLIKSGPTPFPGSIFRVDSPE